MKFFSSKRRMAVAAGLILLALFWLRPGASQLKSRIVSSISAGVGRPAEIGSVHIRLLPQPGFDLENLVVYDDPAFGAEPILRASEVTAELRLMSLLRGRLEIARLDLTEPSLNLVHRASGGWNLEALLERTAHNPLAPTGKAKSEPRPGFPYIEATSARINFKNGPEKKPYALTNADFSLWQDSENTWGVRLKAQPFRTDMNLNDTGLLQVNGTWQRAEKLRDTPLQMTVEWSRGQLGQVTKFFTGNDKGWRGGIQIDVSLSGTPSKLSIASGIAVEDFRRYDIPNGKALRLAGRCDGEYSSLTHEFHEVMCSAPVANGLIALKGDIGLPGSHRYGIEVTASDIPASAVIVLAQRAKRNLPEDLTAEGTLRGDFSLHGDSTSGTKPRFEGHGEFADFRLSSPANKAEIGPQTIPFVLTSGFGGAGTRPATRSLAGKVPDGTRIEFGPFAAGIGRGGAPTIRGWVNRGGYSFAVSGETEIGRALRAARIAGLPALSTTAEGTAQIDLQIAGSWTGESNGTAAGFAGPQITGSAKLRNVRVALRGAGGPIEILAAEMQLAPDAVRIGKLSAKTAGTAWTGSLEMPRGCSSPENCAVRFVLNTSHVSLSELRQWVSPAKQRPWYRVLESNSAGASSLLASLHASGRITADHLQISDLDASHVSAKAVLASGKLQLSDLEADFLGGKHRGEWQADFSLKPAVCSGRGSINQLSLTNLAAAMKDPWIAGTAKASYEVKGPCPAEFWQKAEGTLQVDMTDGVLPHVLLGEDPGPFKVTRLLGDGRLRAGQIEVSAARVDSPGEKYLLSGTASLTREVDFRLARISNSFASPGYEITGTLSDPKVTPLARVEQARLKPAAAK